MKCFCKRDGVIILLHCFTASYSCFIFNTLYHYYTVFLPYYPIISFQARPPFCYLIYYLHIYALKDNFKPARPSIAHFSGSGLVATDCYNHDLRLSCLCGGLLAYTSGSYLRCRKLLDIYIICIIYLVIHSIIFAFIFQSCIMIKS